jgi:hypothetical protein
MIYLIRWKYEGEKTWRYFIYEDAVSAFSRIQEFVDYGKYGGRASEVSLYELDLENAKFGDVVVEKYNPTQVTT